MEFAYLPLSFHFLVLPTRVWVASLTTTLQSDVIPWQCWSRYPEDCHRSQALFVDVDFPDLIKRKRQVVLKTPALVSPLSGLKTEDNGQGCSNVFLRSDRYFQVGCDLRRTAALEQALASVVDIEQCLFLFVAEVSITYMETDYADSLLQWASTISQCKSSMSWYSRCPPPPTSCPFFASAKETLLQAQSTDDHQPSSVCWSKFFPMALTIHLPVP